MGLESEARSSESRFAAYVEAITSALGHADRAAPFRSYCAGLLLPGERKSVEPMAARVQPGRVQAAHQSLHHLVAKADWSDDTVLAAVRARVLPIIERRGAIRAVIIVDTEMPDNIVFQTKPQIALDQLRASLAAGIKPRSRCSTRDRVPIPTCATASPRSINPADPR